jgi:hypothetical protein
MLLAVTTQAQSVSTVMLQCASSARSGRQFRVSLPRVGATARKPPMPMPKRKPQPRDIYTDWEDENVHVQLTGKDWRRAIARGKEANWLIAEVLERAMARARRNRRDGEVR